MRVRIPIVMSLAACADGPADPEVALGGDTFYLDSTTFTP
jgi:hypothetical protein